MARDVKKRNAIARDLKSPKYRPRVVKDKRKYTRKGKQRWSPEKSGDHALLIPAGS